MESLPLNKIICHDVVKGIPLPDESIDVVITSPPYWGLRVYGDEKSTFEDWEGQLGLEPDPQMYINHLLQVCREIKRVLKKTGCFYLNLGDKYCSLPSKGKNKGWIQPKQLLLIPSRVAIALQDDGWILRNDIVWYKMNHMPDSVKDRLANSWEHVFLFTRQQDYYYDLDAIREPHKADSLVRASYGFKMIPRAWKQEAIPVSGGKNIDIDCHPAGKNPGDVSVLKSWGTDKKLEYHGTGKNNPMGQSPSDLKRNIVESYKKNPKDKNPGDFWGLTTQPFIGYNEELEHFAVFPEALVVQPLLASCPKFICSKCGRTREKIWKKPDMSQRPKRSTSSKTAVDEHLGFKDRSAGQKYQDWRNGNPDVLLGLTDCGCKAGFNQGVVLDPFCGRGTVGKVAKQFGFNYILFDIKPEYCELAKLYIAGQKNKLLKGQKKL